MQVDPMAQQRQEPQQAFVWGKSGRRMTADEIARERAIAEAQIAEGGSYAPVQHWLQGAARMSQGIVGGLRERKALRAEEANTAETDISPDAVRSVLHDLDKRIKAAPPHWHSPSLLAIDNIHCGRKPHQRNYQVLFDQGSGHAIGFVESETVDAVLKEIQRLKLDAAGVRVFSSDLSETNLALAKIFKSAIHVADKFHVFQHCNLGIKAVINSVARSLSENGNPQAAERLRSVRRQAIGARMPVVGQQGELQFEPLPVELSQYEAVDRSLAIFHCHSSVGQDFTG